MTEEGKSPLPISEGTTENPATSGKEPNDRTLPTIWTTSAAVSRSAAIAAAAVVSLPLMSSPAAAACTDGVVQTGDVGDPGDCVDCVAADCVDPGDTDRLDYSGDGGSCADASCDACSCSDDYGS